MHTALVFGMMLCVLSEGNVIDQTPVSHLAVTRRFITVNAGDNTYYGDMSLNSGGIRPILQRLESDLLFDISLYDRITIEENGEFEVNDEGAYSAVSGDKVMLWVLDRSTARFHNALTLMFGNGQEFSRFMRVLHQYTDT
ncbi:uncharacterized protein LOC110456689 [Mizuhopecten yessoensis]|uniref:uncharacterized protein LOC110456689 n=1 Tax=Mizuhopecten yessoensis TaxID=6573 RepID=UPI000B45BF39|nr:uncharacterized protein LOC110456689 [Mizuhopecten yessoensis]